MKSVYFVSILCLTAAASVLNCRADDGRQQFRDDMNTLSKATLQCQQQNGQGAPSAVNFRLVLKDADYKDSFMVEFLVGGKIVLSSLVAYEGYNGHLMGVIKVTKKASGASVLRHSFDGAIFNDVTEITESGKGLTFRYLKISRDSSAVAREINCNPVK